MSTASTTLFCILLFHDIVRLYVSCSVHCNILLFRSIHSTSHRLSVLSFFFFFQAEDGIRDYKVTGVQTCALPISLVSSGARVGVGVEKSVVGVHREPNLRAVDRELVFAGCVAHAACEPVMLWPPGIEQIERELDQLETELLSYHAGPLCRLGQTLDREADVDPEAHSRFVCR